MTADRPLPYAWSDVRDRLQAQLPALLDRLGLRNDLSHRGRTDGARIYPLNPTRNDRRPGSFVIWTGRDAAGAWHEYATGEKGDVFDLVAYVERLQAKIDVYWWALDFLRLDRLGNATSPRTKAADQVERERRAAEAKAAAARAQADDTRLTHRLTGQWLQLPEIKGTVAETYLREARRLPLDRLKHWPGALRFQAQRDHIDEATGEVTTWPCMVSAMTKGAEIVALHYTWLAPDGSGKAPVTPAKKMRGRPSGAAIRLSPGPSGLSPSKAAAKGRTDPLAIGEGIETCLTVAAALPAYRVWAAGSLSLIGMMGWPACASAVVLLGENDGKPQALKQFQTGVDYWRRMAQGRPVHVVASAVGVDFNDWAMERRKAAG